MPIITGRQEQFIKNYVRCRNGSRSALEAGYSPKGANRVGSRLLSDIDIKKEIDRQIEAIEAKLEITEANIIDRLWQEATTAQRSADRTNALTQLARIKGLMKDTPTQSMAIFYQIEKELRQIQPLQPIDTQADTEPIELT